MKKRTKQPNGQPTPPPSFLYKRGKPGRMSSIDKALEEKCRTAYEFCLLGATNSVLANVFDVSTDTIYKWMKEVPNFARAVREGREYADSQVAHSLYMRAIGYEYEEKEYTLQPVYEYDEDGSRRESGKEMALSKRVVKSEAPNVTAQIIWLKNRTRRNEGLRWSDRTEIDHTSSDGSMTPKEITVDMSPAKAAEAYRQMLKDSKTDE